MVNLFYTYSGAIPPGKIGELLGERDFIKVLPTLLAMKNIITNFPSMNHLSYVLKSLPSMKMINNPISVNEEATRNDLSIINDFYYSLYEEDDSHVKNEKKGKLSKENIFHAKQKMFTNIYTRFSNEFADEAFRIGKKELSIAIRNNALSSRTELSRYINLNVLNSDYGRIAGMAKKCAKIVIKKYSDDAFEDNYMYIKSQSLLCAGKLPIEDYYHHYQVTQRNFSSAMGSSNGVEEANSILHNNSVFFNAESLTFISLFFSFYSEQLSASSVI